MLSLSPAIVLLVACLDSWTSLSHRRDRRQACATTVPPWRACARSRFTSPFGDV